MSFAIVLGVLFAVLFLAAYMTKRRFGVRGLALVAGAMLATLWVGDLTPIIAEAGFVLIKPPLESVVATTLTLLPALLLLSFGQATKTALSRVVGSALFALLAIVLLLEPLGSAFIMEGLGQQVYLFLTEYRVVIITACLVGAIMDLVITKTPKVPSKH